MQKWISLFVIIFSLSGIASERNEVIKEAMKRVFTSEEYKKLYLERMDDLNKHRGDLYIKMLDEDRALRNVIKSHKSDLESIKDMLKQYDGEQFIAKPGEMKGRMVRRMKINSAMEGYLKKLNQLVPTVTEMLAKDEEAFKKALVTARITDKIENLGSRFLDLNKQEELLELVYDQGLIGNYTEQKLEKLLGSNEFKTAACNATSNCSNVNTTTERNKNPELKGLFTH